MTDSPAPAAVAADPLLSSKARRHLQRAETYQAAGQSAAALASLEAARELQPGDAPTLLKIARLHLDAGRYNAARAATLQALECHLESPRVALDLVSMLNLLSESRLMLEIARQLPPPLWDSAKSLAELAQELIGSGAHAQAAPFVAAALERDPGHPPSLMLQATLDLFHGRLESTARHAERCLDILPNESGAHFMLSRLRAAGAEERVARIERALALQPAADDQSRLAYALHNELHDLGEYDRAWKALEHGCRAKRTLLDYDPARSEALFDQLCAWTREEIDSADGFDEARLQPVFVIGLHRSGTTLAERILSGHPEVAQGGETYDIRAALRRASGLYFQSEVDARVLQARAGFDYARLGEGYLRGIAWRASGLGMVTDKLPSNYFNVGFIARALPRARFIHLQRDPVDVGLSSLRTLFSHACPYSYDQLEYVAHYRNYRRLMAHWRQLLPDRLLDVRYADLVQEPEATAERMARFCGLQPDPAMTRIEERADAVSTASTVMMRDGIRRDRGRLWTRYEQQLQPMIHALAELPPDPA